MKKIQLVLVLSVLLILSTSVASADPPVPPHPGPAMFYDYPDCYIFDAAFNWYYIADCSPTIAMETNSKTGVIHWHAHAQLPDGAVLPERGAQRFTYENSGVACYWDDGTLTTNYSIIITPNGKFNINCHFRPDKWLPY